MKIAVIYDTKTNTTAAAASFIREGICRVEGGEAACYPIAEAENDFVREADGIILGSPTYMAAASWRMTDWLQQTAPRLKFAGKLGGAFATEQYIHGGAERVIADLLTFELVSGMLVYSGGSAYGKPIIHLGPVGMSQDIGSFRELFETYGERFALQLKKGL